MTPERHAQIRGVFLEAAALSISERAAFLDHRCLHDPELRVEVQKLLSHHVDETLADPRPAAKPLATNDWRHVTPRLDLDAAAPNAAAPRLISEALAPKAEAATKSSGAPPFSAGDIVGRRYRLVALLGRGGMGSVYRADDLTLDQPIAIKFLDPRFAGRPDWVGRFRNEARLARRVTHPNVCRVYDIGESEGHIYLSMEYIDGEDLASLMRRVGRLSFDKATEVARQVCTGLAAAHGVDVLHRDLKPANIMLDGQGRVRLTDFGIAVSAGAGEELKMRAGTPAYMAPEQIAGLGVDVRSDVYALGLVLYELYAGEPAFYADSVDAFARLHEQVDPVPLPEIVPGIDPTVDELVRRCLSKKPADRPVSALAVAAALPGVDVLSVAMAANQTPSPALVADASVKAFRVTRPGRLAWLAVVSCLLLPVIRPASNYPWERPGAKAPAVLAEQAASALRASGNRADYSAYGYCSKAEAVGALGELGVPDALSTRLVTSENELLFWSRTATEPLIPGSAETLLFGNARVSLRDPWPRAPGHQMVLLDSTGRMRGLWASAPAGETSERPVNWDSLFTATGVRPPTAEPTPQSPVHTAGTEKCLHWPTVQGAHGMMEVHACSANDRVTLFLPLNLAADSIETWTRYLPRTTVVSVGLRVSYLLILALALPMAWRNYRSGRSDMSGAMKTGTFVAAAYFAAWLVGASHAGVFTAELSLLSIAVARSVSSGALVIVTYLGLEPAARRYWPQLLVGWTRLLQYRRGDAVVWEHVLAGIALGCFWALLASVEWALVRQLGWSGGTPYVAGPAADRLLGGGVAVGACLRAANRALAEVFLCAAMLAFARCLVRRPLAAAVLVSIALIPILIPRGAHPVTSSLLVGGGVIALGVWVMVRAGLLTLVVAAAVGSLLNAAPLRVDATDWCRSQTVVMLALVSALALYAFWAARRSAAGRA